jgi:hypothetical protein
VAAKSATANGRIARSLGIGLSLCGLIGSSVAAPTRRRKPLRIFRFAKQALLPRADCD